MQRGLLLSSFVVALACLPAAPALALPVGCEHDAQCLIEHVFGGSGAATPVRPAAAAHVQVRIVGARRSARRPGRYRVRGVDVVVIGNPLRIRRGVAG